MGTPGKRLRPGLVAARERMGWTQEQAAAELGVAVSTWARWERGKIDLRASSRARLVELFGVSPDEVERWVGGEDARPLPWLSAELGHLPLAATVDAAGELWRWDVGADPARRRILAALPFVPSVLGEWLLAWAYDPPEMTQARTGPGPAVGVEDVRRIHEARQAFAQMDHQFGGGLVRPAVVDYLNTQVAPLLTGAYSDEVGAQLMTAAASMTRLAGWEAYDLGRNGLAQAHFGQALRLAKAASDPLTAAWVLAALAQQACDLRHPQTAVRLSRAARHAGQQARACPRVRALLLVREARSTALGVQMAETHDEHAAKRVHALIGRAERAYAAAKPDQDDEPAWVLAMRPAELAAEIGCAWRLIGEHEQARACAERALRGLGAAFPRSVQFNTVHLAQALAGAEQLDAALDHARAAVPMARALSSQRSIALVREFDAALDPRERRVREWREFLRKELPAA